MGMLEIRTRQERLGNLGRTMSPDFRNGAAEAARAAGDAWAAAGRAARDAGGGLMSLAVTLGRVAEHDHRVRYDAFLADAREEFDAWMRGDGSAENPGKINEKVEDPARWAQEISARWGEVTRRHRERHGITDHEWESEVKEMVRPYGDQWTGRVLARALQVREHNALVSAQANVNADEALLSGGDGSPEVYRAYARHVEALLDAQGVTDPDARAAKRRAFALRQCEEGVKAFIVRKAREADDAAGAGGAKAGERVFDEAIAALGEAKDGKAFFPPNAVEEVRGADGRPAQVNIIGRWADGADMGAFAKAAADDLRRAKERWAGERAARERADRAAVVEGFTRRELEMRDIPQERWAGVYEDMGRDESLRKADPRRAMAYMDAASEIRKAAKVAAARAKEDETKGRAKAAEAQVKANEDALATALSRLQVLRLDGSVSQEEENDAQAAIWRRFRVEAMRGGIGEPFMRSFQSRLQSQLSDQEKAAMRRFYREFGFTGEIASDGRVPAAERKLVRSEDFYAPHEDGADTDGREMSAADLFAYGEDLLRTLRSLGPDMNREGVVEREIARLKTDWLKAGFSANRDATVRSILDMQREARAGLAAGDDGVKDTKGGNADGKDTE